MFPLVIAIIMAILIFANSYQVPENYVYVIEKMGSFYKIAGPGRHMKLPFIEKVAFSIPMLAQHINIEKTPIILSDNKMEKMSTTVSFHVEQPMLYAYGVANPNETLKLLALTTIRNVCGEKTTTELHSQLQKIEQQVYDVIANAADTWGIGIDSIKLDIV